MQIKMSLFVFLMRLCAIWAELRLSDNKYPVPLEHLMESKLYTEKGKSYLKAKLDLVRPTFVWGLRLVLGQNGCKGIGKIRVLYSNQIDSKETPKDFTPIFTGQCEKLLNLSDKNRVEIKLMNTFYAQFMQISISVDLDALKGSERPIKDYKIFTTDTVTSGDRLFAIEEFNDTDTYDFDEIAVSKIVLQMDENFYFRQSDRPSIFLPIATVKGETVDIPVRFKKNYEKTSYEAVFPAGFKLNKARIVNNRFLRKVEFYGPGQYKTIGETSEYSLSIEQGRRNVTQIYFPDIVAGKPYNIELQYYKNDFNPRSIFVTADTKELNLFFKAKHIELFCPPKEEQCRAFDKFEIRTIPCDELNCENAECGFNYSESKGYGCICDRKHTGLNCSTLKKECAITGLNLQGTFYEGEVVPYTCENGKRRKDVRCRDSHLYSLSKGRNVEAEELCA